MSEGAGAYYLAVEKVSAALLAGRTLQTDEVSAGFGMVVDWRTANGDVLIDRADAFDTACIFVLAVGAGAALHAVESGEGAQLQGVA